ncbi:MAG: PQQ-binding-like beta-propeller repeat protein, partial [Planctomycetota bacterium]
MRLIAFLLVVISVLHQPVAGEEWNQFRGASAGKLAAVTHPLEWSAETNVAWAVPMTGSGWSSPVVIGDRIYFTAAEAADGSKPKGMMAGVASMGSYRDAEPVNHTFTVNCLQLTDGETVWSKTVGEMVPPVVHPSNTYATESPATDGERLFTFFATTGTLCGWDLDGNELWRKELGTFK